MGRREERDVQRREKIRRKANAEIYCRVRREHIKKKVKGLEKEK